MSFVFNFSRSDFKDFNVYYTDFKSGKLKNIESIIEGSVFVKIKVNDIRNLKYIFSYLRGDCSWNRVLYNVEIECFKILFQLLCEYKLINISSVTREYIQANKNDIVECILSNLNEKDIKSSWLFTAVEHANLDAVYLLVKYKVNIYELNGNMNILQFASDRVDKPTKIAGPIGLKIYNYIDSIYKFKYAPTDTV